MNYLIENQVQKPKSSRKKRIDKKKTYQFSFNSFQFCIVYTYLILLLFPLKTIGINYYTTDIPLWIPKEDKKPGLLPLKDAATLL